MGEKTTRATNTIQATEISFRIVEEIRRRNVAGVSALADELDLSKSTVHDHLTTLVDLGYVERAGSKYRLGLSFLTLGGNARQHEELYEVASTVVDELAAETEERVKIVVERNGKGIYLYQARGTKAIQTDTHVGATVHLHSTAAGKAMLAHLPPEKVESVIDEYGLPAHTEHTITAPASLRRELETVRSEGIAFDDQERMEGIRCIAAPLTRDGDLLGSISLSGPKTRIYGDRFRTELPETVSDAARVINIMTEHR